MNNPKGKLSLRLNCGRDAEQQSLPKTNGSVDLAVEQVQENAVQFSVNYMDQSPFKVVSFRNDGASPAREHDLWLNIPSHVEGEYHATPRIDSIVGRSVLGNFFNNSAFNSRNNSIRHTGKRFDIAFVRSRSPSPDTRSPIRSLHQSN